MATINTSGLDIRENSIRLRFTFEGQRYQPTLMVAGEPMAPTQANIRHAARRIAEIKAAIKAKVFNLAAEFPELVAGPSTNDNTVGAQLDKWLGVQRIEKSTKTGYGAAVAFWKSAPVDDKGTLLGSCNIRTVRVSHLLKASLSRPDLKGKTVNNYLSVLKDAFQLAKADGLITTDPSAELKRVKHQKEPPDPFDPQERETILARLEEQYPGQVHNMAEFWFWTGLRTGEILGLRWDSVDLTNGYVQVQEAKVLGEQKTTKTKQVRQVILNSRALAALNRQRGFTQMAGEYVFHDPRTNRPWVTEQDWRRGFWSPTLKILGFRYRRPYQMRHTYASTMLTAGMRPAFCAKQLGHSVDVFLTTYAKWLDGEANDREMARLEASIGPGLAPNTPQKQKTP